MNPLIQLHYSEVWRDAGPPKAGTGVVLRFALIPFHGTKKFGV